jgi:anti-sigma factor RsiW
MKMFADRFHPSDRELLLAADRELSSWRSARVERHLDACASCRTRSQRIRQTLEAASDAAAGMTGLLPPASPARARLRAGIAELSRQSPSSRPPGALAGSPVTHWPVAAAAALALAAGLALLLDVGRRSTAPASRGASADVSDAVSGETGIFLLPRPDLTPGAAHAVSTADVCGSEPYRHVEPVSAVVYRAVFDRYGADFARTSDYELDYLITPELGGSADERNLWPQPFSGTTWNAYVKDELELHLHQLVCAGTIDVATAQREIATDWIAAYKRRFRTDRPRRDYAASPLTEHDSEMLRAELAELGRPVPSGRADGPLLMAMMRDARK